jgi:hypothetical protein
MSNSELRLRQQEEQIPQQAHVALAEARQRTLAAGLSVLTVRDNQLVEVAPDGSSHVRKQVASSISVRRGLKIKRAS